MCGSIIPLKSKLYYDEKEALEYRDTAISVKEIVERLIK